MKARFILWVLLSLVTCSMQAQRSYRERAKERYNRTYFNNVVTAYTDFLNKKVAQYWLPDSTGHVYQPNIRLNPIYYRLFAPLTVYHKPVLRAMDGELNDSIPADSAFTISKPELLPLGVGTIMRDSLINNEIDRALVYTYLQYPTMVAQMEDGVMGQSLFKEDVMPERPRKERVSELITLQEWNDPTVNRGLIIRKPNFWSKNLNVYLQFTQNYISDNWYKGGESNNSMLSGLDFQFNYNDKQRIQFDNRLEWKLGYVSSRSDTVHKYKPNNDLLRFTSKLGVKAFSSWYYTIQTEFSTQIMASYKTNSNTLNSKFMSPGYLKVNIGMDYKKSLKRFNVSAVVSPLSYKLSFVGDENVDETKFGIEKDHKSKNDIGSNLTINYKWTIIPQVVWESRISYFTPYNRSEAEWENTFNFQLNRFLATKLFVHGRFDDGVEKDEGESFFQLSELLSFGLSYNF